MSRGCPGGSGGRETRRNGADVLALAASPVFAVMALLTGALGGGAAEALCSAAPPSPLSGMAAMYVLMSAFHATPWLRIIGARVRSPVR